MIDTWDWILIYSVLFLLGGLLAYADDKSGARPQDRARRPHDTRAAPVGRARP
jgi:hypothetical protein